VSAAAVARLCAPLALGMALGGAAVFEVRAVAVAAALVALVVLAHLPAEATLVFVLAGYAAPLTWIAPALLGDTRPLATLFLLPLLLRAIGRRERARVDLVVLGTGALGFAALTSLTWSSAPAETVNAALALMTCAALFFLVGPQLDAARVVRLLRFAGASIVVASLLLAALPMGQLAGRIRGIFGNPNSLATLVVLVLPFLLVGRWRWFGFAALLLVVLSGSRAGAAACLIEIVVLLATTGRASMLRRVLLAGLIMGTIWLGLSALHAPATTPLPGAPAQSPDASVLRLEDSRSGQWQTALAVWRSAPAVGIGAGASQSDPASSYLKLLMELGLVGLLAATPLLARLARTFVRGDRLITALAAGAAVNALFESWLFTAGSFYFLVFWLALLHRGNPDDPLRDRLSDTAARAGHGSAAV